MNVCAADQCYTDVTAMTFEGTQHKLTKLISCVGLFTGPLMWFRVTGVHRRGLWGRGSIDVVYGDGDPQTWFAGMGVDGWTTPLN